MGSSEFQGALPPQSKRPKYQTDLLSFLIKDGFKLPTLMLFGAIAQSLLCLILAAPYAYLPAAFLSLSSVVTTLLQLASPKSNGFDTDSIRAKFSAQLPDPDTGRFGSVPAASPVVVFHLGVRFNHPLGPLAPGAREVAARFESMSRELKARADDYGLLTVSTWRAAERASHNTLMFVYYFRSVAGVHRFAHDAAHHDAWGWFRGAGLAHVAIFHETFEVRPGAYETVYVNAHPLLLGRADTRRPAGGEKENAWVSPLVLAESGPLRTQLGRMGRSVDAEA